VGWVGSGEPSPKEYDVLRLFVHHAGKGLTHAHILREVWVAASDPRLENLTRKAGCPARSPARESGAIRSAPKPNRGRAGRRSA
jgi:hypothetical protein